MAGSLLRRMNQWQTSGRCHKCCVRARWAPWRVLSGILCLGAINEPTEALAHSYEFAGRLGFWQKWTATPGSHNMGYANLRGAQCYNPTILPRGSTLCSNPNPPPNGAVILGGAG